MGILSSIHERMSVASLDNRNPLPSQYNFLCIARSFFCSVERAHTDVVCKWLFYMRESVSRFVLKVIQLYDSGWPHSLALSSLLMWTCL